MGPGRPYLAIRTAATKAASAKANLVANGPVAKQLEETRVWGRATGGKKLGASRAAEPRRVNVVSKGLCGKMPQCQSPTRLRNHF